MSSRARNRRGKDAVPISMGSTRFKTLHVGGFEMTDAWFPPGAHLPWHTHGRTVMAFAVQGDIQSKLSRRTLVCHSGDVWTEPAGDGHANSVGRRGARVLVVQPDPARTELLRPARSFLDAVNHVPSPLAVSLARKALPEIHSSDPLAVLQLEGLALELLATAARIGNEKPATLPAGFVRALERLHDEYRQHLTVGELAKEADLHPSYFAKVFRRHAGCSVGEYVRHLRVQWAAEELIRTSNQLGTIALRAGFSDQSHFSRTFKRLMGHPPSEYRRINRPGPGHTTP